MLLLAESPSFEFNYFKNYWSTLGHGLVQKVKISKDRYSTSFINIPSNNINRLTEEALDNFDVLMLDLLTWNGLASRDRSVIKKQIEEKALAVIFKIDNENQRLSNLPEISVNGFKSDQFRETEVSYAQLSKSTSWQKYKDNAVLEMGYGKILVLGITDTYKLILNDEAYTYQTYWADLISELYLEKQNGFDIELPFITLANEVINVKLSNLGEDSKIVLNGETSLPLLRTPLVQGFANASIEPKAGWNKMSDKVNGQERWFYAFDKGAWSTMDQSKVVDFAGTLERTEQPALASTYSLFIPISWWLGFAISLLGFGLLWLDEKLFS
jgi:hypothetical protein